MATCPHCREDAGEGSRCENCGELIYRYAVSERDVELELELERERQRKKQAEQRAKSEARAREFAEQAAAEEEEDDSLRSLAFGGSWENRDPEDEFPDEPEWARDEPKAEPVDDDPFASTPPSGYGSSYGTSGDGPALNVPTTPPPPASSGEPAKQGASGCAIAAIVVGALIVLALVGAFIAVRAGMDELGIDSIDDLTSLVDESAVTWDEVGVGDCLVFIDPTFSGDDQIVEDLFRVDCTTAHDIEAFGILEMPEDTWPGDEATFAFGDDQCWDLFEEYVGIAYEDSYHFYQVFTPTEEGWDLGDRGIVCALYSPDGQLDRSLRDARE